MSPSRDLYIDLQKIPEQYDKDTIMELATKFNAVVDNQAIMLGSSAEERDRMYSFFKLVRSAWGFIDSKKIWIFVSIFFLNQFTSFLNLLGINTKSFEDKMHDLTVAFISMFLQGS